MQLIKKQNWKVWKQVLTKGKSKIKYEKLIKNLKDSVILCMLKKTVFKENI